MFVTAKWYKAKSSLSSVDQVHKRTVTISACSIGSTWHVLYWNNLSAWFAE